MEAEASYGDYFGDGHDACCGMRRWEASLGVELAFDFEFCPISRAVLVELPRPSPFPGNLRNPSLSEPDSQWPLPMQGVQGL